MTEWKAAGHAGRDQEQALWERFSASRRAAFDRRRSMAAERDRQRGGARAAKRALIEQAQALIEPFDAAAAEPALARQMDEWKAAGSAGRADDEELWQAFRAARDQVLDAAPRRAAAAPPRGRRARRPPRGLRLARRLERAPAAAAAAGQPADRRAAQARGARGRGRAAARRGQGRAAARAPPRRARSSASSPTSRAPSNAPARCSPSPAEPPLLSARCRRRGCRRGRARPRRPRAARSAAAAPRASAPAARSARRARRRRAARCSVPPAPARSGCSSRPGISAARPVATCTQASSTRCSEHALQLAQRGEELGADDHAPQRIARALGGAVEARVRDAEPGQERARVGRAPRRAAASRDRSSPRACCADRPRARGRARARRAAPRPAGRARRARHRRRRAPARGAPARRVSSPSLRSSSLAERCAATSSLARKTGPSG